LRAPPFHCEDLGTERDFFFSLGFPAGAILVDRYLRYSLDLRDMIGWLPPLPRPHAPPRTQSSEADGETSCVTAVTRHELLRGWNAAHGLPKADEWMIGRGAVYVYRFRGTTEQLEQVQAGLDGLEHSGIGLRRNEGFGVVEVSSLFHQRFCRPQ
jgi:hypothetical protein